MSRNNFAFFFFFIGVGFLYAQDGEPVEMKKVVLKGTLDKTLPVRIAFQKRGEEIEGTIQYADKAEKFFLEGTVQEGNIVLFEFDQDDRVSSVIEGPQVDGVKNWQWSTADYSLSMPIILMEDTLINAQVELFRTASETNHSQIFMRRSINQMSIDDLGKISLRWFDFECEAENCYEVRPNVKLSNPIEFVQNSSRRTKEIVIYPEQRFVKKQSIAFKNKSDHEYNFFYSYNFPDLDPVFNKWIDEQISNEIKNLGFIGQQSADESENPSDRLSNRAYGDFYITLLSKDLVSGFLLFYGSHAKGMKTRPFIYDRSKERSYGLKDIFKSDFDYPFFLKKILAKKKRAMLIKEPRLIKSILKDSKFRHLVLAPEGLLFATDFNVVFGRRQILVPFSEFETFVDNKAISAYLKHERTK